MAEQPGMSASAFTTGPYGFQDESANLAVYIACRAGTKQSSGPGYIRVSGRSLSSLGNVLQHTGFSLKTTSWVHKA